MKRHEGIVTISREHHFGLLFCWKIRQGIRKNVAPERILPYVKYFWENHLLSHFNEEETLLFTLLQDALVEQALAEHKHIRQLVEEIMVQEPVQTGQLDALVTAIDDHIRFEERTLFPHFETELPEDQLLALGAQLAVVHSIIKSDAYADEFWVSK